MPSNLSSKINQSLQIPLSNFDIKKIDPDVKITTAASDEFLNLDFADELTYDGKKGILLWPTISATVGHWLGVLINKAKRTLEIFDPYGITPIEKLSEKLNGDVQLGKKLAKHLRKIIRNNGYKFIQNKKKIQNLKNSDDQACGRYVLMRLAFYDLSLKPFFKELEKMKLDPKYLAVLGTTTAAATTAATGL